MISANYITEWAAEHPWCASEQIEQDGRTKDRPPRHTRRKVGSYAYHYSIRYEIETID